MISLSRAQAAAETSLSQVEIDRAIRRGDLKAKKLGRRVVILSQDLEAFIKSMDAA